MISNWPSTKLTETLSNDQQLVVQVKSSSQPTLLNLVRYRQGGQQPPSRVFQLGGRYKRREFERRRRALLSTQMVHLQLLSLITSESGKNCGEFGTTDNLHFSGGMPSTTAPAMYGSGLGLPSVTSQPVT